MSNVDDYINQFDGETKQRLRQIRDIVTSEVPAAEEDIIYSLVGYRLNKKPLIYFGGFTNHIGLYAMPTGHEAFAEEFAAYKQGKGSVQFPLDQPLPTALIRRVVQYRKAQMDQ